MEIAFWVAALAIVYAYFGYPALLLLAGKLASQPVRRGDGTFLPTVTVLVPAYNEAAVIGRKLDNLLGLDYPHDRLQLVVVSDGSTDGTNALLEAAAARDARLTTVLLRERRGKANALNQGLARATGEIVVFSDSSILLDAQALRAIVQPFADPGVGCVSGEDHIPEGGGEGLYGRYELFLRNRESAVGSIVGASGSFYAERRAICRDFVDGLAPDFLSVLNTVQQGYRAVTEPAAFGFMSAVKDPGDEFRRKVRTLLRGMTTLWVKRALLDPLRHGRFAWVLLSHKIMRWLVPLFMVVALAANLTLVDRVWYAALFAIQMAFYGFALLAWWRVGGVQERIYGKVPLYFVGANLAAGFAWVKLLAGVRQELWEPSRRA
jgi:cellulose synthase/poly-beta-1,6-N-acetylglucosamine synthase-like glycosyltransferase